MKRRTLAATLSLLMIAGCAPLVVLMTPSPPPGLQPSDKPASEKSEPQEATPLGQGKAPLPAPKQ